jgi:hypothetical protein
VTVVNDRSPDATAKGAAVLGYIGCTRSVRRLDGQLEARGVLPLAVGLDLGARVGPRAHLVRRLRWHAPSGDSAGR